MKRLMKAELYKFGHEKSVWIISAVLIACACISIFTQVYASAEDAFTNLGIDVMVLYLACAIYAGGLSAKSDNVPPFGRRYVFSCKDVRL